MSRFPFGIPNSWYVLAYSEEVPRGEVVALDYLGRRMVAFRGESGEVSVLDAHCPHLGAHLAFGGRVEGDTLRAELAAIAQPAAGGGDDDTAAAPTQAVAEDLAPRRRQRR